MKRFLRWGDAFWNENISNTVWEAPIALVAFLLIGCLVITAFVGTITLTLTDTGPRSKAFDACMAQRNDPILCDIYARNR